MLFKKPYTHNQSVSIAFCNVALLLLSRVHYSLIHLVIDFNRFMKYLCNYYLGSLLLTVEYIKMKGTDFCLYLLVLHFTKALQSIVALVGG